MGSDYLLLSREVAAVVPDEPTFWLYRVGDGDEKQCGAVVQRRRAGAGRPASTPPPRAPARGSRCWRTTRPTPAARRRRVALRLFTAAAPGAEPVFRCEIGARGGGHRPSSTSPTFSPDGSRLAWAESDGIHVAALGALTDCDAIRERVVTLPGAWEPYWSPADDRGARGAWRGAARLSLGLTTRARPRRATVFKHGDRRQGHGQRTQRRCA